MTDVVGGAMEPIPTEGSYKHFKGDVYDVAGVGKHSETGEELVIYRGDDGDLWARPLRSFREHVDCSNRGRVKPKTDEAGTVVWKPYKGPRFTRV